MDRNSSAGTMAPRKAKSKALSSANERSAPKAGRTTRATAPNRLSSARRRERDVTKWKLRATDIHAERPKAAAPGTKVSGAARTRAGRSSARAVGPIASTLESVATLADLAAEASENTLAINPLIGIQGRHMATAAGSFLKAVA